MAGEFPAVSQSRIDFWKQPQYTRKGMLIFTVLFGFFGLHHFLLRSPQTGLLLLIANVVTLGYCYFYDIVQLTSTSVDDLNEYGMSLPWSAAGIAKGMWVCKDSKIGGDDEPPNPFWFLAYSLLLPLLPLAKLFTGDNTNALLSFLYLPLGFLLTLYEYCILFFYPGDIFVKGVNRPPPHWFWDKQGKNQKITIRQPDDKDPCPDANKPFYIRLFKDVFGPILQSILPPQVAIAIGAVSSATEQGAKTAETVLKAVETSAGAVAQTAQEVTKLTTSIPGAAMQPIANAQKLIENPPGVGTLSTNIKQGGGGFNVKALQKLTESDTSIFDKAVLGLIAAVIGGGFLLHTGRSFADVIHQSTGQTDAPPQHS
jgi:hypothetical protein